MTESHSSASQVDSAGTVSEESQRGRRGALRAARESKGVHLVALAGKLKVPVARLQALEEGRFEEFADPVFVRTLALSVCRHLDVDPAEVLAELPAGNERALEKIGQGLQTPFREHSGHAFLDTQSLRVRIALAGGVVGVQQVLVARRVRYRQRGVDVALGVEVHQQGVVHRVVAPPAHAGALVEVADQVAVQAHHGVGQQALHRGGRFGGILHHRFGVVGLSLVGGPGLATRLAAEIGRAHV